MRSMLFVPGDSPRKFEKARLSAADALILDLEDSVAEERKDEARATTRDMLAAERSGPRLYVRVNALDTGRTLADLASILPGRPDGIVLPKCEGAEPLRRVAFWLDGIEAALGQEVGRTRIVAIATENAASIFELRSYAGATPRLEALMWGAEDLAASLGATENRNAEGFHSPYRLVRDLCLVAAAAAGIGAIDTVHTRIEDLEGLRAEARAARRDGFSGKAVIHPSHVEPVNSAFSPTEAEIAFARRIVAAFAADGDLGVLRLDGKMIDKPHLRAAETILALAASARRSG